MAGQPLVLRDVMNAIGKLTIANTKDLAFRLGVELSGLDDVDTLYRGAERSKYYIEAWLTSDTEASWEKIVDALKDMNQNVLAASIARQYCSSVTRARDPGTHPEAPVPTLGELLRLKIPLNVGVHYKEFGTFLLEDDIGAKVSVISARCRGDPAAIVTDILQQWLGGDGVPATWQSLITTLGDCNLNALAEIVKKHVQ